MIAFFQSLNGSSLSTIYHVESVFESLGERDSGVFWCGTGDSPKG